MPTELRHFLFCLGMCKMLGGGGLERFMSETNMDPVPQPYSRNSTCSLCLCSKAQESMLLEALSQTGTERYSRGR